MEGNVDALVKSLKKSGTAIATSNLVSAIVSTSPSPMDMNEVLELYNKIYDHVAEYSGPERPSVKISQEVLNQAKARSTRPF